jgi:hypothetical protein
MQEALDKDVTIEDLARENERLREDIEAALASIRYQRDRAYIATAALQGMLASKMAFPSKGAVVEASISYADALIAKLSARKEK